ncbi:hypothetical protein Tco_0572035, partial [Tanacetum coccineum]
MELEFLVILVDPVVKMMVVVVLIVLPLLFSLLGFDVLIALSVF